MSVECRCTDPDKHMSYAEVTTRYWQWVVRTARMRQVIATLKANGQA